MGKEDAIQTYLTKHAEPLARAAFGSKPSDGPAYKIPYAQALVVPIFNETSALENIWAQAVHAHNQASPTAKILVILVFNVPNQASKATVETTQEAFERTTRLGTVTDQNPTCARISTPTYDMTLINRIASPLPANQGVGLARKIGVDWALELYHRGLIKSPWVSCTDADVRLPADYFDLNRLKPYTHLGPISALTHTFCHTDLTEHHHRPTELQLAHDFYELYLRHYVSGLAFSGSPYAFHTIGSLLKINLIAYAQVRGFPKRSAGEDFYLLNKLAKVGRVLELATQPVNILPRVSERTPFGTGVAVLKLLNDYSGFEQFIRHLRSLPYFFSPESFTQLKQLLSSVDTLDTLGSSTTGAANTATKHMMNQLSIHNFPQPLADFLLPGLTHCQRQSRDIATFKTHFRHWFDAFKTFKWLQLSSNFHAKVSLNTRPFDAWLSKKTKCHQSSEQYTDQAARVRYLLSKLKTTHEFKANLSDCPG